MTFGDHKRDDCDDATDRRVGQVRSPGMDSAPLNGPSAGKARDSQQHDADNTLLKSPAYMPAHKNVVELLPWLVNGTLAGRERDCLLAHLRGCADCRRERDQLQQLSTLVAENEAPATDHKLSYYRTRARIAAWEVKREERIERKSMRKLWRMGIAASVLVVAGLVVQFGGSPGADSPFRTLSDPETGTEIVRISLTLDPALSGEAVRSLLISENAGLVAGPDESGTYLLDVPALGGQSALVTRLGLQPGVVRATVVSAASY